MLGEASLCKASALIVCNQKQKMSLVPVSARGSDNTQQALRGLLCIEKDKRTERTNLIKTVWAKIKQA